MSVLSMIRSIGAECHSVAGRDGEVLRQRGFYAAGLDQFVRVGFAALFEQQVDADREPALRLAGRVLGPSAAMMSAMWTGTVWIP